MVIPTHFFFFFFFFLVPCLTNELHVFLTTDELSWMNFLAQPVGDEATSKQQIEGVEVVDLDELVA